MGCGSSTSNPLSTWFLFQISWFVLSVLPLMFFILSHFHFQHLVLQFLSHTLAPEAHWHSVLPTGDSLINCFAVSDVGTGGQLGAPSVGLADGLLCSPVLLDGFCLCSYQVSQESQPAPSWGSQLRGSVPTGQQKPLLLLMLAPGLGFQLSSDVPGSSLTSWLRMCLFQLC